MLVSKNIMLPATYRNANLFSQQLCYMQADQQVSVTSL